MGKITQKMATIIVINRSILMNCSNQKILYLHNVHTVGNLDYSKSYALTMKTGALCSTTLKKLIQHFFFFFFFCFVLHELKQFKKAQS